MKITLYLDNKNQADEAVRLAHEYFWRFAKPERKKSRNGVAMKSLANQTVYYFWGDRDNIRVDCRV